MKMLVAILAILYISSASALNSTQEDSIQKHIQSIALPYPSISSVNVTVDERCVGVVLDLVPNGIGYDTYMSMYSILDDYCKMLQENPDYSGYLGIGLTVRNIPLYLYQIPAGQARYFSVNGAKEDVHKIFMASKREI